MNQYILNHNFCWLDVRFVRRDTLLLLSVMRRFIVSTIQRPFPILKMPRRLYCLFRVHELTEPLQVGRCEP